MERNVIEVKGVSLTLSGSTILDEVDISISGGSIYGLLGPSGCGKTSLLKVPL